MRDDGRSSAWAEFESLIARSGHIIIEAGLISPKDWTGMMIDIEQFRKTDAGNSKPPGDLLAEWLGDKSLKTKPAPPVKAA